MANESRIKFSLFSVFSGQGFQEAEKALKGTSQAADMASKAVNGALAAAGQQDGLMGKFASGLQSIIAGFKQGGIAGAALQAVMIGIGAAINNTLGQIKKLNEETEALSKKNAEMLGKITETRLAQIDTSIRKIQQASKAASAELNYLSKQNRELANVSNQIQQGKTNLSIVQLQAEKLRAVLAEETESGKELVAARYDIMLAEKKAAAEEEIAAQRTSDSLRAVEDARRVLALATKNVAVMENQRAAIENAWSKELEKTAENEAKYNAKKEALEEQLAAARQEQLKANDAVQLAEKELEATTIDMAVKREEAANQVQSAIDTEAQLLDAQSRLKNEIEAEMQDIAQRRKEASFGASASTIRQNLEHELAQTQAEFMRDLHDIDTNIERLIGSIDKLNESMDKSNAGMNTDNGPKNWGGYDYSVNPDGGIDAFEDWQRAQRFGDRAARDAQRGQRARSNGLKQLEDLRKKQGKGKLSDREKERLDELEAWEDQLDGGKKKQKELEELQKKRDELMKSMEKTLKKIHEKIEKATLK